MKNNNKSQIEVLTDFKKSIKSFSNWFLDWLEIVWKSGNNSLENLITDNLSWVTVSGVIAISHSY